MRDDLAKRLFPEIQPEGYFVTVKKALEVLEAGKVDTRWTDSLASSQGQKEITNLETKEGMINDRRQLNVAASPREVFEVFSCLGGDQGWLFFDWAWRLRGILDRLVGGVGLRRGRRDPLLLRVGDAVDFWRVESIEDRADFYLLRFRAEMKLPGEAWLQFVSSVDEEGETRLTQTAFFAPKGLSGLLYWYLLYPLHGQVFSGMLRRIKEVAEA